MIDWRSLAISVLVVGALALLLRWAYGGRSRSLVERRPASRRRWSPPPKAHG